MRKWPAETGPKDLRYVLIPSLGAVPVEEAMEGSAHIEDQVVHSYQGVSWSRD